jgi:Hemolysin coregulated protein Hcp (TssD)
MSFLAQLKIDSTTYNILECSYDFSQNTNPSGKPMGVARGGQVTIKIEATSKNDFMNWVATPSKTKDGIITFFKRDAMSKLQEVKFEKAYCIYFKQIFNAANTEPLMIEMIITSRKITFDGFEIQNTWKE